jgi:LacI family transcriptional regulator
MWKIQLGRNNKQDIGAVSMRLLTKLMQNEEVNDLIIKLPHVFVERETL